MANQTSKFSGGKVLIEQITQTSRPSPTQQDLRKMGVGRTYPAGRGGGGGAKPDTPSTTSPSTPAEKPKPETPKPSQPTQQQLRRSKGLNLALERIKTGEPLTPANLMALRSHGIRSGTLKPNTAGIKPLEEYASVLLAEESKVKEIKQTEQPELTPEQYDFYYKSEGIPRGVISEDKTISYRDYIKDRTKITGTLSYLGEKGRGLFGKYVEKDTPKGQELAQTPAVSTAIELAPYFTPIGEPLLLAVAGEQLLTKTGRKEIGQFGEQFEKTTGLPSEVGVGVGTGAVIVGGVLGGYGTLKKSEKLLGYPKFEVRYLTSEGATTEKAGLEVLESKSGGIIRKKGLLSDDLKVFGAESKTYSKSFDDGEFIFGGTSRGVTKDIVFTLPEGKMAFKIKPDGFKSKSIGRGRVRDTVKIADMQGGAVYKEVEGFDFVSGGKVKALKGDEGYNLVIGSGRKIKDKTYIKSYSRQLERGAFDDLKLLETGKGEAYGISKRYESPEINYFSGKKQVTKGSKPDLKTIQEQELKQTLQQTFPETKTQSFPIKPPKVETVKQETTQQTNYLSSQTMPSQVGKLKIKTALTQPQREKTRLRTQQKLIQLEKQKQKLSQAVLQTPIQLSNLRQRYLLKIKQLEKQIQQQRTKITTIPFTPTVTTPYKPIKPIIPIPKTDYTPKLKSSKKTKDGLFLPQIRRFGKWNPLGKFRTLSKARQKARGQVETTLGASYRVLKSGQPLDIKPKSDLFRLGKERGVIIQRRKYRLATRPEVKEIQFFKSKSKGFPSIL